MLCKMHNFLLLVFSPTAFSCLSCVQVDILFLLASEDNKLFKVLFQWGQIISLLIGKYACSQTLTFIRKALTLSSGEYVKSTSETISSTLALLRMDGRELLWEDSLWFGVLSWWKETISVGRHIYPNEKGFLEMF